MGNTFWRKLTTITNWQWCEVLRHCLVSRQSRDSIFTVLVLVLVLRVTVLVLVLSLNVLVLVLVLSLTVLVLVLVLALTVLLPSLAVTHNCQQHCAVCPYPSCTICMTKILQISGYLLMSVYRTSWIQLGSERYVTWRECEMEVQKQDQKTQRIHVWNRLWRKRFLKRWVLSLEWNRNVHRARRAA